MKVVIDKEAEITKLENMLANLTDDKDKQSVRFAINLISGFEERPIYVGKKQFEEEREEINRYVADRKIVGEKNAPRVEYTHSCENFKSKMTNKEAIVVLKSHLHHWERLLESNICANKEGEETIEALKMAIIALREEE